MFIRIINFLKEIVKVSITYACILFCGCIKEKCLDNEENNEPVISSPTPLINNSKHRVLNAYEEKIIKDMQSKDK